MGKEFEERAIFEKHRVVLTENETWIPGLVLFGNAINNKANTGLLDHYHNDIIEFVIVVDGYQTYTIDEKEYTLYGNDVFVTFPNEIHSTGENPQMVSEIIWFQIDMSQNDKFLGLIDQWQYHIYDRLLNLKKRTWQVTGILPKQFLTAFKLLSSDKLNQKCKGSSLFVYCLIEMLEMVDTDYSIVNDDIKLAKEYIDQSFTEEITLEELSDLCKLSLSSFKHKFKDVVGMAPREYINFVKINSAKALLTETSMSITDIAFHLGYNSSNYFCVSFKQFTGISPRDYRKTR